MTERNLSLAKAAQKASANAYAPYSGFAVGAAVRTKSGNVYTGANLENASLGLTMCAEVGAITGANSAGDYDIEAIAVVGHRFQAPATHELVCTPCGRCRQLIFEASQVSQTDILVLSCNGDLSDISTATISELLPMAFGPANLGIMQSWPQDRQSLQQETRTLAARSADAAE